MGGGESDGQLWAADVVPLQGGIAGCQCDVQLQRARGTLHSNGIQKNIEKNCLELLADVTLLKDWFLLSGVYAGIIFLEPGTDPDFLRIFPELL